MENIELTFYPLLADVSKNRALLILANYYPSSKVTSLSFNKSTLFPTINIVGTY